MAVELVMPRQGWSMEVGSLVEWLKGDGDEVQVGDAVYSIQSDKAINEIEALDSGILRIPPDSPAPGVEVPVGTVLAYLVQPGERAPFEINTASSAPQSVTSTVVEESQAAERPVETRGCSGNDRTVGDSAAISPRALKLAIANNVELAAIQGSGRSGRIVEQDVRAAIQSRTKLEQPRMSPLARKAAATMGVDLENLTKAAQGKRITRKDVEEMATAASPPEAPATSPAVPMEAVRRITATRMAESAHTVAPVTLTTEVDVTEFVHFRDQIKADARGSSIHVPTYNDLLAKIVATVLVEHPMMNSSFSDEGITQHSAVNIGMAVDTHHGLLVPVVRDVQNKAVTQIALESARLIEQSRRGTISADELHGGTFTITNLGMYGIDAFTPIVNLPECAILGVGRIVPRPVIVDEASERIAVRKMMVLSLTFDHRVVDGAPAALFLKCVKEAVEHPHLWLIR